MDSLKRGAAKYAMPREEERPALFAYCTRHLVGFISNTDTSFYGSGVIVAIYSAWAVATAAHVATALRTAGAAQMVFPGAQSSYDTWPAVEREYRPLCVLVSDARSGRTWRPDELDLAVIVPPPDAFTDVPGIGAIDLALGAANPRVATGGFCILGGFPERLQHSRADRVFSTNIVGSHFIACPPQARSGDIAINWTEVLQLPSGHLEDRPGAGGMSGGPVFLYSESVGSRVWTPRRQLPFAGILHYQAQPGGEYLLAHSSHALRDFILANLNDPEQIALREALAAGYREAIDEPPSNPA